MASFDRLLLAFTAMVFMILVVTSFSTDDAQIREQPAFTTNR